MALLGRRSGYRVLKLPQLPAALEPAPLRATEVLRLGSAAATSLRPAGPWAVPGLQCGSRRAQGWTTAGEGLVETSLPSQCCTPRMLKAGGASEVSSELP